MVEIKNERTGEIYLCYEPSDYVKPEQYLKMTYKERLELYRHHRSNFDSLVNQTTVKNSPLRCDNKGRFYIKKI